MAEWRILASPRGRKETPLENDTNVNYAMGTHDGHETTRGARPGMFDLKNKVAVITGAAGGIGRGIALALAKRGCHLALADIDEAALARTAAEFAGKGIKVTQYRLDVSNAEQIKAFPARVLADHAGVDLLFNNAGVAIGGTFEQVSEEDFDWLLSINLFGVIRMTRAFMPVLRQSAEARIVNLSSLFGLIAPPGQTAYSASKFAVRGFSNSLRHELEMEGAKIGVTVVHPGGIATSIAKNARIAAAIDKAEADLQQKKFQTFLKMPPEQAGEIIVRAVEKRQPRVLVGNDAKAAGFIERLFPVGYWKIIGRQLN